MTSFTRTLAITASLFFACTHIHADERIKAVIKPATDFTKAERYENMSGGAATSRKKINANTFSHSSANLTFEQEMDFKLGNAMFRKLWVSAPASTQSSDGLGPIFNARSCQRCHLKDGRGQPPTAGTADYDLASMLFRLSVPPETDAARTSIASGKAASIPEPTYGGQLQDFAVQGIDPEGKMFLTYEDRPVTLGDGSTVTLRKPRYEIKKLNYGPLHADTMISPRVAPPMIGLGLLDMISNDSLMANADPDDRDGDGISGKASIVWSSELNAKTIGRFGWKAGATSVREQTGGAFNGDIGISNPIASAHAGDCTAAQKPCLDAPHGDTASQQNLEIGDKAFDLVVHYSENLAVPARRDVSKPEVLRGKELFYASGCISCHTPKFVTKTDTDRPEHSRQLIWPYTDLLLHDMGEGLADNRPDGLASGQEWRTAPLWGIGLTEDVSGHTFFLHDGRARNLLEAILWHGGEAEQAKETVRLMDAPDRNDLLEFLGSL